MFMMWCKKIIMIRDNTQLPFTTATKQKGHPNGCPTYRRDSEPRFCAEAAVIQCCYTQNLVHFCEMQGIFIHHCDKTKRTPEWVSLLFGGEGGIRTLELLLTVTRFPIVRARPATRLLPVKDALSWALDYYSQLILTCQGRNDNFFQFYKKCCFFSGFSLDKRVTQW